VCGLLEKKKAHPGLAIENYRAGSRIAAGGKEGYLGPPQAGGGKNGGGTINKTPFHAPWGVVRGVSKGKKGMVVTAIVEDRRKG